MTTPTVIETRRNGTQIRPVGERVELARYTVSAGERVLHGQRVDGVVRFLPEEDVVLDRELGGGEDIRCRPRQPTVNVERADAARPKRPSDRDRSVTTDGALRRCGNTGRRVELARYRVSAGERVLYGQRVHGVVRVTDRPQAPGGRAYLVERGLEQEGSNANAALQALITDYLMQASVLDEVPMAASPI